MSFPYTYGADRLADGQLKWTADTIKMALLMVTTSANTQRDVTNVGAFTTLGEYDGSGYTAGAAGRITLASKTKTVRPSPDFLIELLAAAVSGLSLSGGSSSIAGLLLYADVGANDANNVPLFWIDDGGFPVLDTNLTGVTWPANGIWQLQTN